MINFKFFLYITFFFHAVSMFFSNSYIDDINKVKSAPSTYGAIDAKAGTELHKEYENFLPFDLKDFSVFAELKGFVDFTKSIEDFINRAFGFSKINELYYLDPNLNKPALMVKEAYTFDAEKNEKIDDRKYNDIIMNKNFYIMEHDAKTGKIALKGEVKFINENEFTLSFTNINEIRFIINLVDKGGYNIFYHFIKYNEGYFIYAAVKVKAKSKLLVWLIKKPEDFENRLIAFFKWFEGQLKE